ncbi:hypothetical protein IT575_01270 [bacterium]|nr:hypothetical protein [bacterium]
MAKEAHPGEAYPEECRQWMELTMQCAAAGDIPGCMEMQQKANECLRRHGIFNPDLPETYFRLMHESLAAARDGDMVGAQLIGERMNELLVGLGLRPEGEGNCNGEDAQLVIPEECVLIESAMLACEEAGDFAGGMRLLRDFDKCLQKHGIPSPNLPDEWFEIQIEMHDAQERGDSADFERLRLISEKMMRDAGIDPDEFK